MLRIRASTPADEAAIAAVILPIQQAEFSVPITLADQPDLQDIANFYQHGRGNFWVAEISGKIIGTIALLDIGNQEAALRKMFVVSQYRGREHGIAQYLLTELLTWAAKKGIATIYLGTTAQFLAAQRFYEKSGFSEIAKSGLPSSFPVMAVDSKFYKLTVQPDTT
ncbi:MAG: GNAT family N-acetyltransferase [Rhodanobacteraceae bacterium]|nr:GNAT family N-acetyltransferase [Rhodanobacteraceae bacterium]